MPNTEINPSPTHWLITFGYRGGDFRSNAVHRGSIMDWLREQAPDVVLLFAVSLTKAEYDKFP